MPAVREQARRLVLDAGPLIALAHTRDPDHRWATAAFRQLSTSRVSLVVPVPIVFEVYKWLLHHAGPAAAREGLMIMGEALEMVFLEPADLDGVAEITRAMPGWPGTLEDATVVVTALRLRAPVWTLNYRDFRPFTRVELWNPA